MALAFNPSCNDVSLGLGTLYVNGRSVGYLKNTVEYSYEYEVLKFYQGNPQVLTCQFVTKLNSGLKATYAELSPYNLSASLGMLETNAQANSSVTVSTGSPQTFQPILDLSTGNYWFRLGGTAAPGGMSAGAAFGTVVLKDGSSTLTLGTDYTVDNLGNVALLSGGAYIPGDAIHASYTYGLSAGVQIPLGAVFALNEVEVLFVHKKLNTSKRIFTWIPRCTVTGKVALKYEETNVILNELAIDALVSSAYPSFPFGHIYIES